MRIKLHVQLKVLYRLRELNYRIILLFLIKRYFANNKQDRASESHN